MNISAFILSAGFGERLRPITTHIPKPLLPILGKPILQLIIEKISKLNPQQILINLHYKKELIEDWLKFFPAEGQIIRLHEKNILGTGGALKNAEKFLKGNPFIVYNSDVLSDIDLRNFIDYHLSSNSIATLAVHDYKEFNKLEINEKGFLKKIQKDVKKGLLAFTGIAIYNSAFLRLLPQGNSSIVDTWMSAINKGYKIGTFDISGTYWRDIGTPTSYFKAVIDALKKEGEMVYIHPSIDWCGNLELEGYVIIEKNATKIPEKDLRLKNCLVLPESHLKESIYENNIIFSKSKIQLNEMDILEHEVNKKYILVGSGGSDRKYYRIKENNRTIILMQSNKNDVDFIRHLEYTSFFSKYGVSVPKLLDFDLQKKQAYFEDLGDITLYSWLKCPRSQNEIEEMYKRVIDILILIHTTATAHVNECPLLKDRIFDYEHFRWETNYFIERFVQGIMNIDVNEFSGINEEFHRLALKVSLFQKTIIHRDFQSQNIMIIKKGIPKIIDYQGARIGPPAYDVVSLIWDPYRSIDDNIRERLVDYYVYKIAKNMRRFSEDKFRETLLPCRLQRHMQALGAYGFLSKIKGKKYFLKYVPHGLRLLIEDVRISKKEYPKLFELIEKLQLRQQKIIELTQKVQVE